MPVEVRKPSVSYWISRLCGRLEAIAFSPPPREDKNIRNFIFANLQEDPPIEAIKGKESKKSSVKKKGETISDSLFLNNFVRVPTKSDDAKISPR